MTGAHVLVRGRLPEDLDAKKVMEDLDDAGHVEIYGYPADGRVIGTTWMHIEDTPRNAVPAAQERVDNLIDAYVSEDEKLTDEEQAAKVIEGRKSGVRDGDTGSNRSAYYDIDPEPLAQTGPFLTHSSGGQGPHPVHGGTSTPDKDSTNFGVDAQNGWKCWAHGDGGGALQLIAVLEGIRSCGNASDVMQDPIDALVTCLAARDKYTMGLDDENPPTAALKGVCEVQGLDYPEDGPLSRSAYTAARGLWDAMSYTADDASQESVDTDAEADDEDDESGESEQEESVDIESSGGLRGPDPSARAQVAPEHSSTLRMIINQSENQARRDAEDERDDEDESPVKDADVCPTREDVAQATVEWLESKGEDAPSPGELLEEIDELVDAGYATPVGENQVSG